MIRKRIVSSIIARSTFVVLLGLALIQGCSDDDPEEPHLNAMNTDAGMDVATLDDAGPDPQDTGSDEDADETPEPTLRDTWDTVESCTWKLEGGGETGWGVAITLESSDPEGCVRVVIDEQEDDDDLYNLALPQFFRTVEARVQSGLCEDPVASIGDGVEAESASGSIDLSFEGLNIPEEILEASLDMNFPPDEANPFGPLNAIYELPQGTTRALPLCD